MITKTVEIKFKTIDLRKVGSLRTSQVFEVLANEALHGMVHTDFSVDWENNVLNFQTEFKTYQAEQEILSKEEIRKRLQPCLINVKITKLKIKEEVVG